jgi:hypothetical protein
MAEECPRSYVSTQSLAWVEEHQIWRLEKIRSLLEMPAKQAEAFALLEAEVAKVRSHDEGRNS